MFRIEKDLSQEQLAHLCDTSASYIRKVEAEKVNISMLRLHEIVAEFELSLGEFFSMMKCKLIFTYLSL
ncbi:helix-turn-helix domain-containing protein [Portibacter marinus]|uniref:helix-turn-helix domain-containing protein n=1 Tax=Portibacter marinus TaxID=2898660 RepID=UPI003872DEDE